MSGVSARDVRSFLVARLKDAITAKGLDPKNVPEDFDLLTEGIIDSLGLLELITAVESKFDTRIDFENLDPENITIIGYFCSYIEQESNTRTRDP